MALNTEQTKSIARMCYDLGKLIFAVTTLDAIVKSGQGSSLTKIVLGLSSLAGLTAAGLSMEQKLKDPPEKSKPKRRR